MENKKYIFVKEIDTENDTYFDLSNGYEYMKITDPEIIEIIKDYSSYYHRDFDDMFVEAWTSEVYRYMYGEVGMDNDASVILASIVSEEDPLSHAYQENDDFDRFYKCARALADFHSCGKHFPVDYMDWYISEESQADLIIQFWENCQEGGTRK